jgi:hypothetical protein
MQALRVNSNNGSALIAVGDYHFSSTVDVANAAACKSPRWRISVASSECGQRWANDVPPFTGRVHYSETPER